ncbi:E3 ubiquitin-protein ligase RHA2A-like [Camellia sinensis]|uniref:E3 ubiquitin-protein ligase RHA2A-like n=1 Tax=Camellia sinensis TaxID=4442 RepID=UPI001035FBDA|nr:E3 ubiquitin-protein ligase RHA2A-like [Camellia sinensis]
MGLQGHVSDCSSESMFIFILAMVANFVSYLRSVSFLILRSMGRFVMSTGFANLIVLADQLNLNRLRSYPYEETAGSASDCVVCMSKLRDGEKVRRLACRHAFHKECLDGWLDHLNFSCPLCRSPLVSEQRVVLTQRRVRHDLLTFFSLR